MCSTGQSMSVPKLCLGKAVLHGPYSTTTSAASHSSMRAGQQTTDCPRQGKGQAAAPTRSHHLPLVIPSLYASLTYTLCPITYYVHYRPLWYCHSACLRKRVPKKRRRKKKGHTHTHTPAHTLPLPIHTLSLFAHMYTFPIRTPYSNRLYVLVVFVSLSLSLSLSLSPPLLHNRGGSPSLLLGSSL
ncbi:hypothetical protein CGRA01v4_00688 [Colletotrichum graminicola]|nr:hypothetical protein CGRA01v4_00688 [Colletotrichum graminicola]